MEKININKRLKNKFNNGVKLQEIY